MPFIKAKKKKEEKVFAFGAEKKQTLEMCVKASNDIQLYTHLNKELWILITANQSGFRARFWFVSISLSSCSLSLSLTQYVHFNMWNNKWCKNYKFKNIFMRFQIENDKFYFLIAWQRFCLTCGGCNRSRSLHFTILKSFSLAAFSQIFAFTQCLIFKIELKMGWRGWWGGNEVEIEWRFA